ncbi:hypothetical protein Tco_1285855 [Tanacetum coccineum]
MKFTTDRLIDGSSCGGIDMVIKDLDLEPKDVIAEFCGPSRWKELSKETSSKSSHVEMDHARRRSSQLLA